MFKFIVNKQIHNKLWNDIILIYRLLVIYLLKMTTKLFIRKVVSFI